MQVDAVHRDLDHAPLGEVVPDGDSAEHGRTGAGDDGAAHGDVGVEHHQRLGDLDTGAGEEAVDGLAGAGAGLADDEAGAG